MGSKKQIQILPSVKRITEARTKKGKIKGKNKKETRILKDSCPHHIVTKKNEVKPMIYSRGDGTCTCKMCHAVLSTTIYNKEQLNTAVGGYTAVLQQMKFLNVAINGGKEADKFLVDACVQAGQVPKLYKKLGKAAAKKDQMKRNKNKNKSGNSTLGSWGPKH